MGYNICGIVVNSLPVFNDHEAFDKKKLRTKFCKTTIKSLSPKDLNIGFKDTATLIFLDMIFYKNISEESELTPLERDLNSLFPGSRILIMVINDTIDFTGYSLIENGIKVRTKVVVNDEIFLDFGELNVSEMEVFEHSQRIIKAATPKIFKEIEEEYAGKPEIEKKKYYIRWRDAVLKKFNKGTYHYYTDGSLDSLVIETEFGRMLDSDYSGLEQVDCIQFERRKLNFKKDSLKEYLFIAMNELRPFTTNKQLSGNSSD